MLNLFSFSPDLFALINYQTILTHAIRSENKRYTATFTRK